MGWNRGAGRGFCKSPALAQGQTGKATGKPGPQFSPKSSDRCRRWDIEVFFKKVKQSLKLGSFLGHSANAVRWQVYTALLVYVLLRFMAHLSEWGHRFTRLFAVTRSALWERIDLLALLKSDGTASLRKYRVISTARKKVAIGIPPKSPHGLVDSRIRKLHALPVGRKFN